MEKFFGFLKSCVDFVKIVVLFCVMMLLLQWIEHLTGANWAWMNFIRPVLNFFLAIGESFSDSSVHLFNTVVEYKYGIAIIILFLLYFVANWADSFVDTLEDTGETVKRTINKNIENAYNKKLVEENTHHQKKINKYRILVITNLKKEFARPELNYNIDEQNIIMNKFLIEKTGISPERYEGGFLYKFGDFEQIDNVLKTFFKLTKSESPLDFVICVQVFGENINEETENLKKLASLQIKNKICMMSDTAYRYKYNAVHRYPVSQVGLFQKDNGTIEVHEFIEI